MTENMMTHDDQVEAQVIALLKKPYARLVMPESDGTYRGEILEFPGCIATGDNPSEAYAALDDAAKGWLEAALSRDQPIPEPVDANEFSGRMVLRIPRSLHKKASRLAERDRGSLNQIITVALAEYVGDRSRPSFNFTITANSGSVLPTGYTYIPTEHNFGVATVQATGLSFGSGLLQTSGLSNQISASSVTSSQAV